MEFILSFLHYTAKTLFIHIARVYGMIIYQDDDCTLTVNDD